MLDIWAYIFLGIFAFMFLFGLVPMIVSMYEKRYVKNLQALEPNGKRNPGYDAGPHPYLDAVNEQAGQLGFEYCGTYVRATKGATRARTVIWRASERDILVRVTVVKAGPLQQKVTSLISLVGNHYLVTTDDFGEDDISGLLDFEVLQNAHFPELLDRHEDRLERSDEPCVHFVAENVLEDMDAIQIERARRMVELGYGKFRDPEQSIWSYTFKGAVHFYFRSYLKQMFKGMVKGHRQYYRRPGS
jgi:hypothetical protein